MKNCLIPKSYVKITDFIHRHVLVISVLRKQRQEEPWSLMTRQSNLMQTQASPERFLLKTKNEKLLRNDTS